MPQNTQCGLMVQDGEVGCQLPHPLHREGLPSILTWLTLGLSHTGSGLGPYLPSRPLRHLHNFFTLRSA